MLIKLVPPTKSKEGATVLRNSKTKALEAIQNLLLRPHQATLSMGFSRQEYWSGLPFRCPLLFLKQARHVSIVGTCCAFCQEYSSSEYTIVAASLPSCLCSNVISYKALSLHLKLPPPHLTLPFLFPCLIFTVKLFYAS